jgi:hypothetical protein
MARRHHCCEKYFDPFRYDKQNNDEPLWDVLLLIAVVVF